MPDVGECKSCHADILWVLSTTGKPMPLDPNPRADGNVIIVGDKGVVVGPPDLLENRERTRYVTHFTTCPHAKEHRNR